MKALAAGAQADGLRARLPAAPRHTLAHALEIAGWLATAAFFMVTFIGPLVLVIARSFGDPLLHNYVTVFAAESTRTIVLRTLRLASLVTVISLVLAYPAAYAMTRLGRTWRNVVLALVILPFLTSYLVRTYGWIAILGRNGPVAAFSDWMGWGTVSFNGTLTGLVTAMTHMLLPLMLLPLFAAMSAIDRRQLLAAGSMGARPAETFVRVFMPQTVAGVISGCLLVFVLSLGFFVTPVLIGGLRETTIAQIIYSFINELFDWGRSASLAVTLLLAVLLLLYLTSRFVSLASVFGLKASKAPKRRQRRRFETAGAWSLLARAASRLPLQGCGARLATAVLVLDLAILLVPLFYVVAVSFQPLRLLALPTEQVSLTWYRAVFSKGEWGEAGSNSLAIGLIATAVSVPLGYFLAYNARRRGFLASAAITFLAISPLALPHILLALGLYGVYAYAGWVGKLVAVALAHAVIALPYVFVNISNGLAGYDTRLDQAAASLGAPPWVALARVKIPVLKITITTAAALAFLSSFDELVITLFTAGPALPTLPVRMWAASSQNISPELAVIGTLLILMVAAVFGALRALQPRRKQDAAAAIPLPAVNSR